jgi:tRNA(fMet)-specific endonuclease VapC
MQSDLDYLLDSSVCIAILRGVAGVESLPDMRACSIPVIVAAELWTGISKNPNASPVKKLKLQEFLGSFKIIEFNMDAAIHYAEIRAHLELSGNIIGSMDLLIAAQARSLGSTLITSNVREFERVSNLKILAF